MFSNPHILSIPLVGLTLAGTALAQSPAIDSELPPLPPVSEFPGYGEYHQPWQVYTMIFDFDWEETFNNEQFVKETGTLWGLGVRSRWGVSDAWSVDFRVEVYGETVDYDGGVQQFNGDGSITTRPLQDKTDYVGTRFELTGVHELTSSADGTRLAPFIGLGLHGWQRDLGTDTRFGYEEDWTFLYLPVGIEASGRLTDTVNWFAQAKYDIPIETTETAPGDDLEPDANGGFSAEAGIEFQRFSASVFFQEYSFDESPANNAGFLQPESEATALGIRLGFNF